MEAGKNNSYSENIAMIMYRSLPQTFRRLVVANSVHKKFSHVDVFCVKEGYQPRYENLNGVRCIRTAITFQPNDSGIKQLMKFNLFTLYMVFELIRATKTRKYSAIHVHNPPDFIVFSAVPLKLISGSKIILDLHDMLPEIVASEFKLEGNHPLLKFVKLIEKLAIKTSDAIICTNNYDKEIVLSRNKIDPEKIFIMYNSPDMDILKIEPANKDDLGLEGKYIIIFEGWLSERRGIHTVIEAIEQIKDRIPIMLIVLGDGPYFSELIEIIKKKNLGDFVTFKGWVDLKTLSEYLSIADLCIIPFLDTDVNRRGVPNKLFEYIAHDKPVISSNLRGIASTFNDQEITFFVPGNVQDLTKKIVWCYNNPELLKSKAVAAKKRYHDEYTWDKMEAELYRCYGTLLGSEGK